MIEEPKEPRVEGDELIIETQDATETYDGNFLVAGLLVFVARVVRYIIKPTKLCLVGFLFCKH